MMWLAVHAHAIDLVLDNGIVLQTYIGDPPVSESRCTVIELNGNLLDGVDLHNGYVAGIVETNRRPAITSFAGLEFPKLTNARVRRVTQVTNSVAGSAVNMKRFYRITNDGAAVTGSMSFSFVDKGANDEKNNVQTPWVLYGNNQSWDGQMASANPIVESVIIPAGITTWSAIHYLPPDARIYARIFLEGPYRYSVNTVGPTVATFMSVKLRHSPRAVPPDIHPGDCLIPVISPFADRRDSGYKDPDQLPENIVDWIYVQFRPGSQAGDQGQEILLGNGHYGLSCFLRNDGMLLDVDGREGVTIPGLAAGNYYLVIDSRTHLKVMSATALATKTYSSSSPYDFTTAKTKFYAFNNDRGIHATPVNNKWLVAAGDGTTDPVSTQKDRFKKNHQVENRDYDFYNDYQGQLGFLDMDFDMGGQVEGRDANYVMDNYQTRSPFSWPAFRHEPERDPYYR
jgi:hypothetical protein